MKKRSLVYMGLISAVLIVGFPVSSANASYSLDTINSTMNAWQSITASNDGTKIAAVVSQDGIYVSTDSGVSFTNRTSALATQPSWNKIVSSANGRYLAASAYVFGTWVGGVYVSSDYGATWTKVVTPAQGGISSIAMSSDGSKIIAAVSNGGGNAGVIPIYRSSDYGANWTNTNTGVPAIAVLGNFDGLTISDDGVKLAASFGGFAGSGVIYSTDSGASWTEASGIPTGSGRLAANADGSKIAFKTGTNPVYFSTDFGVNWSSSSWSGSYPGGLTMSSDGNKVVLITSVNGSDVLYISLDGGASRTSQNLASGSSWNFFTNRAGTKVFLTGYNKGIYSIDLGPVVTSEGAAAAAASAASAQRETEKRNARAEILAKHKNLESISLELFAKAEIAGITQENIQSVQTEVAALPKVPREDLIPMLKIARKYEVVGMIASERVVSIYSNNLIEIGLIDADSKHKAAVTKAIRELPASERSSYTAIKEAINAEMAEIQARKDRLAAVLARIASRGRG